MASNLTTFSAFLKHYYNPGQVEALTNKDRPFYAKVKKTTGSGDLWVSPIIYANPQGLSSSLANAQTGATQSGGGGNLKGVQWQMSWGDYDGAVDIGDKVIAASRDNVGAFFENKKAEIDRLYEAFADTMSSYFLGDSGHSLTPGTFTISAGVCTLTNPDDIVNIEVGQILNASANDGTSSGHTLLGSGSNGFVISLDRNLGTFTVSTTAGGTAGVPSGWTGTMYAFRLGDFGGSGAVRILLGLGAWVPAVAPTGGVTFEGVDRAAFDTLRLSGVRLAAADTNGLGNEQRLKKLVTRMTGRGQGPGPSDIFVNPEKWQVIADSLESRGTRPLDGQIGKFNYQKLQIAAGGKLIDIWADRFVPVGTAFAVNMDYIELKSLDGFPKVVNGDGLTMLRLSTTNDYEYRIAAYPAFCVKAPGFQGRVAMV